VNRRPRGTRALALGILIGLAGCGSQRSAEEATVTAAVSDLTEPQRAAIGHSVEQAWSEMMAGARALDPARIRARYSEKPIQVVNGVIVENFDSQFERTRRWLGSLRQLDATYDNVHLEVLSPSAALATMNHHLSWTDTVGAKGEWHSAWTAVFRRNEGQWKVVYSHESVVPVTSK
jgi:ketosteroid isomerase-like protein